MIILFYLYIGDSPIEHIFIGDSPIEPPMKRVDFAQAPFEATLYAEENCAGASKAVTASSPWP